MLFWSSIPNIQRGQKSRNLSSRRPWLFFRLSGINCRCQRPPWGPSRWSGVRLEVKRRPRSPRHPWEPCRPSCPERLHHESQEISWINCIFLCFQDCLMTYYSVWSPTAGFIGLSIVSKPLISSSIHNFFKGLLYVKTDPYKNVFLKVYLHFLATWHTTAWGPLSSWPWGP